MYIGNVGNRETEISQFLQPYIEERFQMSCQWFQLVVEYYGLEVWNELKTVIRTTIKKADLLQKENKKGKGQYFIISFLKSSVYLEKLEWRIDILDEGFYLDNQESEGYYLPRFLQGKYWEDLDFLLDKTRDHVIRLQNYEWIVIKKQYTELFAFLVFQMIHSLIEYIVEEIEESKLLLSDQFKIIYGEYMDRGIVLYEKEKREDEIFFNKNR